MQPLDVSVFRPLKLQWSQAVRKFTDTHPDEIINQTNFASIFVPLYYETVNKLNIKSGFKKCGLFPFNPDSPDYGKLEAAAAQREPLSNIFQGINQGGFVEMATQTEARQMIHKVVQVHSSDLIENEYMDYLYPGEVGKSKDDMVLDFRKYAFMRRFYNNKPLVTPLQYATAAPTPSASTPSTSGTQQRAISPAFINHVWYPERRVGRGPK
ncbi:unnamed protein product, partial [Meganyctiphanes norvegica]